LIAASVKAKSFMERRNVLVPHSHQQERRISQKAQSILYIPGGGGGGGWSLGGGGGAPTAGGGGGGAPPEYC
jgi:hypothetical protein